MSLGPRRNRVCRKAFGLGTRRGCLRPICLDADSCGGAGVTPLLRARRAVLGSRSLDRDHESEAELLSFAGAAIGSVCALELLILLRREPGKQWGPEALVHELRSSPGAVAQALDHLRQSGLVVEAAGGFQYQQSSPRLDDICRRLESQYAAKPVTVIRAIVEAPSEKLRLYADAFRVSGKTK